MESARRNFLEARRRASQLEGLTLSFSENAGEDGQLFGSVTVADIADRANAGELDFDLDKKCVQLDEVIKSCLLYTSPSPRDKRQSRMPSSA